MDKFSELPFQVEHQLVFMKLLSLEIKIHQDSEERDAFRLLLMFMTLLAQELPVWMSDNKSRSIELWLNKLMELKTNGDGASKRSVLTLF